jgi:hypothetical protein
VVQNKLGLLVKALKPNFIVDSGHDASAELSWLHQPLRELDLIQADVEEEENFTSGFVGH